jgi:dihydroorotate dehydrogenase (fumarate)
MPDLSTTYLGLSLSNPLIPSSSPLTRRLDGLKKMEDAGAGAVVLYSLFEEQALLESKMLDLYLSEGTESFAEALTYLPEAPDYRTGPDDYMEHIFKAKAALSIPVIASLNGYSPGGWVRYAREMEQAGADALELNMYFVATDPNMSGRAIEDMYVELLSEVKSHVKIPIGVKLSPFFTSLPNMAMRLTKAGARGLVLFNRFYQPDIDIEMLDVVPHLVLSDSEDLRLPLRWIAVLYGKVDADLALTSGVHTTEDVVKGLLAGATVTMMASELLQNGLGRLSAILKDLHIWLEEHEYESVAQLEGSMSLQSVANPAAFERANYMRVLGSYTPGRL